MDKLQRYQGKKRVTLDQLYMHPEVSGANEMDVRIYNDYPAIQYITRQGLIVQSGSDNVVYRYVKNYKKYSKKYALTFLTKDNDLKKVEKWLDAESKNVKSDTIEPVLKPIKDVTYE